MLTILHTADLHIGRTLEGESRLPEQRQVLAELAALVREKGVDLLLIAGDVFDTFNPSAEAEACYYDFLEAVTTGTECGVVVIAGHHDQPDRLAAAQALAAKHRIFTLALPNQRLPLSTGEKFPKAVKSGPNWLELKWRDGRRAVIAALPYLSEGRLGQLIADDLSDEAESGERYSKKMAALFGEAAQAYDPQAVNLAMGHLFAVGGQISDSERSIQVGGSFGVEKTAFPPAAQYVALGHLHRKQQVKAAMPCYYSGAPLACGFAEAGQQKVALLVQAEPGRAAQVEEIPLTAGYPLLEMTFDDYETALAWCGQAEHQDCWLTLKLNLPQPLTEAEIKALRGSHPRLLRLEVQLPELAAIQERSVKQLPLSEQFALFAQEKRGAEAPPQLVQLFLTLAEEEPGQLSALLEQELAVCAGKEADDNAADTTEISRHQ